MVCALGREGGSGYELVGLVCCPCASDQRLEEASPVITLTLGGACVHVHSYVHASGEQHVHVVLEHNVHCACTYRCIITSIPLSPPLPPSHSLSFPPSLPPPSSLPLPPSLVSSLPPLPPCPCLPPLPSSLPPSLPPFLRLSLPPSLPPSSLLSHDPLACDITWHCVRRRDPQWD